MILIEVFKDGIDITKGDTCYSLPWEDFLFPHHGNHKFHKALWRFLQGEGCNEYNFQVDNTKEIKVGISNQRYLEAKIITYFPPVSYYTDPKNKSIKGED